MDTAEARSQFEDWKDFVPDFLQEFFSLFPHESRASLDFSPQSLDVVEASLLAWYPDTESMLLPSAGPTVNLLACYVGETFRKSLGGDWDICLDDPEYAFYGLPIIRGTRDTECPLTLVTASADRRTGTYMRDVLENSRA